LDNTSGDIQAGNAIMRLIVSNMEFALIRHQWCSM